MGTTVVAVLAEPSRPGLVLSGPAETSPLSEAEAADLYATILEDVCVAVERSGGDLPINYRAEDELPDEFTGGYNSEVEIRSVAADALGGTDNAWSEPQVDSTFSARAGSTTSHLLNEEEEVRPAAVVRSIAPLLSRTHLGNAAMKLRSTPVVLGPPMEGRVYSPGFPDSIDFIDTYAEPKVEALVRRADDVGHSLDYVPMLPVPEMGADLATVVPMLRSRIESKRLVPGHATTFVFEEGLRVESIDSALELIRD